MNRKIKIIYKNNKFFVKLKILFWYSTMYSCEYKYQLFNWVYKHKLTTDSIEWVNVNEPYEKYKEECVPALDVCRFYNERNIGKDIADCAYVLDDSDNGYVFMRKPYMSFNDNFRETHCIPCWSSEKLSQLLDIVNEYREKDMNKIIVDDAIFPSREELNAWINSNPNISIIHIEYPTKWSIYYTVTFTCKKKDLNY